MGEQNRLDGKVLVVGCDIPKSIADYVVNGDGHFDPTEAPNENDALRLTMSHPGVEYIVCSPVTFWHEKPIRSINGAIYSIRNGMIVRMPIFLTSADEISEVVSQLLETGRYVRPSSSAVQSSSGREGYVGSTPLSPLPKSEPYTPPLLPLPPPDQKPISPSDQRLAALKTTQGG